MIHWLSFLILCFSIFVEIFSNEYQLPTNKDVVLQNREAQPTLGVSSLKKTNIEDHHGAVNGKLKKAHLFSNMSKQDKSNHDKTSGKIGKTTHVHKSTEDEEKIGKKHTNHDINNYSKHHHVNNHNKHFGKYADGHKGKKTNVLKGYRQQYHKHEHINHDSFYNNGEKTGNFENFGSLHHKKHNELKKKSVKRVNGEKGETSLNSTKKTYKIEKPAV